LDVSIQAQVINLLSKLQRRFELTYLFISHDLSMVRYISNRVAVMYLGKIIETAPSEALYAQPRHPYTQGLLAAIPIPDPEIESARAAPLMEGEVPSPLSPPEGCRFSTRCPKRMTDCKRTEPPLIEVADNHYVACHLCG
jgi:oligopeptide/dipeptide ABC transporter ATP-binding protein